MREIIAWRRQGSRDLYGSEWSGSVTEMSQWSLGQEQKDQKSSTGSLGAFHSSHPFFV
jgi:hypothetical protein